jgi:hypothetical protein
VKRRPAAAKNWPLTEKTAMKNSFDRPKVGRALRSAPALWPKATLRPTYSQSAARNQKSKMAAHPVFDFL